MKRVWYDVCNDYSLERRDSCPKDLLTMESSKHIADIDGVIFNAEYCEIVYLLAPEGLEGQYLDEYDLDD